MARYRLGRVVDTHPDNHGITRTVTVAVRDRKGLDKEPASVCRTTKAIVRTGVQRIVVLLPVEEQSALPQTVANM